MLANVCASNHPNAYDLFNWIVASNNSYIVSLQGSHRLTSMGTRYQFLLRSASPEGGKNKESFFYFFF